MPLVASVLITLLIGVILAAGSRHSRGGTDPAHPGLSSVQCGNGQPLDCGEPRDEEESVMGVAKKAKHEAKAAKSKSKKDANKIKHKGKKVKNAAKH